MRRRSVGWLWALLVGWLMAISPALASTTLSVGLYRSNHTDQYFQGVGGNYGALISPWRQTLAQLGLLARDVRGEDELRTFAGSTLVVPSAVALSDLERSLLKAFKAKGGSLLVTWALGVRDAKGAWLGHGFAQELLGVTITGELQEKSEHRYIIPFGDTPLNTLVKAGHRIWLPQTSDSPLLLSGGHSAAVYLPWTRAVLSATAPATAIAYGEDPRSAQSRPGARWVMFGFNESHWGSQRDLYDDLTLGALQWLQRSVPPHITAWPHARRAAQLIEMDTEDGFDNAVHFAELMENMGARATFYALTSEARKHPQLVQELAARHEVSFHGEVHFGFARMPREIQRKRLVRMMHELSVVLGAHETGWPKGSGRGFRAPTEAYDAVTEELLLELGFEHHAADPNRVDYRMPLFNRAGTKSASPSAGLVVLPRGQLDDLNYRQLKMDAAQVGQALIGEYETNRRMGGLGLLSVHSQNFAEKRLINLKPQHTSLMTEAMETLVKHVGKQHDEVWIATAGEITSWWRTRANVLAEAERSGSRWEIKLTVTGSQAVDGLTLLLPLTAQDRKPQWRWKSKTPTEVQMRRSDALTQTLVLGALAPGKHSLIISGL